MTVVGTKVAGDYKYIFKEFSKDRKKFIVLEVQDHNNHTIKKIKENCILVHLHTQTEVFERIASKKKTPLRKTVLSKLSHTRKINLMNELKMRSLISNIFSYPPTVEIGGIRENRKPGQESKG